MGKRELLLILGFVIVGSLVYVLTAPQRDAGREGFSLGRIIDEIRREARGRPASAEITTSDSHPVPDSVSELRVNLGTTQITIVGEKREDIASELHVVSNGYDDAEAKSLAGQVALTLEPAGPSMMARISYPRPGSQRARLTLRVPSRLTVQFEPTQTRLEVSGVAAVDHKSARGETIFRQIPGRVTATHRGGELTVEDVGSVRLSTRGSDLRLMRVHGEVILQVQAGEVRAAELGGPVDLTATDAEVTIEKLEKTRGPVRIASVEGDLTLRGLATEARIDGRATDMNIGIAKAAPIAIFNTDSAGRVQITPPPGAFTIDAVAADARIVAPDDLRVHVAASQAGGTHTERLSAQIHGGGPTITIRTTRGEIRIGPPGGADGR